MQMIRANQLEIVKEFSVSFLAKCEWQKHSGGENNVV
jgi:hypothetical protein